MAEVNKVFCINCGKQVGSSWKFCRYCGARQETENEETSIHVKALSDNKVSTCRDYVEIHRPSMIDKYSQGGVEGCPTSINKMAKRLCYNECSEYIRSSNKICTKCWDQPYNGERNNEH